MGTRLDSYNSDAITMVFVWTAEQLKEHIALDSHEYYECFQGQRAGQLQPHTGALSLSPRHTHEVRVASVEAVEPWRRPGHAQVVDRVSLRRLGRTSHMLHVAAPS